MRTRIVIAAACVVISGCGPIKKPQPAKRVVSPSAEVVDVRLVDSSAVAARYDVDVTLTNPNEVSLPLDFARFRFVIEGHEYVTEVNPLRALPASGRVTVTLPAVIEVADGSGVPGAAAAYATFGRITYTPPGQIRQFFYELGIPKPKVSFSGEGWVNDHAANLDGASVLR